ncbi:hypothetical protein JCM5353_002150 [Sporobolomyces roseus]
MDLHSTSSTQSAPDASNLPPAIATRIPPELLLDIFSIVSGSPSEGSEDYSERNRNLKSFALVHSAWKNSAQKILREEVFIPGTDSGEASKEEVQRIAMLLLDSKLAGTKYLTVDGHLNELIANTGYAMWRQVRYLTLWTSSRNDGTTRMSDFTPFPLLQELYLEGLNNVKNSLCFDPSDVDLQLPYLRRITFGGGTIIGVLSQLGDTDRAEDQDLAGLLPITHKLFSPSNMPNLVHLALEGYSNALPIYMILLDKVLPRLTTLAIWCDDFVIAKLFPENRILDNLRHLSLTIRSSDISNLFDHGRWNLQSLHLSSRSATGDKLVFSRLIKIAKGEDPRHRIRRIVIYGKRKRIETKYEDLVDDLDSFEWREDELYLPFENFNGR